VGSSTFALLLTYCLCGVGICSYDNKLMDYLLTLWTCFMSYNVNSDWIVSLTTKP